MEANPLPKANSSASDQTTVIVRLRHAISRALLLQAIQTTATVAANLLAIQGDILLPVNPWLLQIPDGPQIIFHTNSMRRRNDLTYGIVLRVAGALMEVLITQHRYFEVAFDIREYGFGRVGGGTIRMVRP